MYGPTGAGKTRLVNDQANAASEATYHKNSGKYWSGYNGEKQVIFDDFDGSFELQDFLRWTDRYPVKVKVYHSERELCSTHSYVTSNRAPWMFYLNAPQGDRAGIMRRFVVFKCKWVEKDCEGYASVMMVNDHGEDVGDIWVDMRPAYMRLGPAFANEHEQMEFQGEDDYPAQVVPDIETADFM